MNSQLLNSKVDLPIRDKFPNIPGITQGILQSMKITKQK